MDLNVSNARFAWRKKRAEAVSPVLGNVGLDRAEHQVAHDYAHEYPSESFQWLRIPYSLCLIRDQLNKFAHSCINESVASGAVTVRIR